MIERVSGIRYQVSGIGYRVSHGDRFACYWLRMQVTDSMGGSMNSSLLSAAPLIKGSIAVGSSPMPIEPRIKWRQIARRGSIGDIF